MTATPLVHAASPVRLPTSPTGKAPASYLLRPNTRPSRRNVRKPTRCPIRRPYPPIRRPYPDTADKQGRQVHGLQVDVHARLPQLVRAHMGNRRKKANGTHHHDNQFATIARRREIALHPVVIARTAQHSAKADRRFTSADARVKPKRHAGLHGNEVALAPCGPGAAGLVQRARTR